MKTIKDASPLLAIKLEVEGLKCDAAGCGFVDTTIGKLTPYVIRENLNRPCPHCGANLLTEADAKITLFGIRFIRAVNVLVFPFMLLTLPYHLIWGIKRVHLRGKMNGSGNVTIESHGKE